MSATNDNTHPVLTVTELCRRWKCDRHSILDAIREGRLNAFRIGKRAYRVALPEVLRYELAKAA